MDRLDRNFLKSTVLVNPSIPINQQREIEGLLLATGIRGHYWLATSGSSATSNVSSKWVALSNEAILASAKGVNEHLNVGHGDRWVHALPHFHVGGLGIWARAYLSNSSVTTFNQKWDPVAFRDCCASCNGTLSALVPTQLYDLVKQQLTAPPSIKAVIIGGGALDDALNADACRLGWCPLPSYGLSECASQVATASTAEGQMEVLPHITDVDSSDEGCLRIRSPALFTCYAHISKGKCEIVDPKVDGWFHTDDLVSIDVEHRTIQVHGRKTSIVKVLGENVNVSALNRLLQKYGEGVITAIPEPRRGHELVYVTESESVPQANRVLEGFNTQVLPFERVSRIKIVSELPRTPLGKVQFKRVADIIRTAEGD